MYEKCYWSIGLEVIIFRAAHRHCLLWVTEGFHCLSYLSAVADAIKRLSYQIKHGAVVFITCVLKVSALWLFSIKQQQQKVLLECLIKTKFNYCFFYFVLQMLFYLPSWPPLTLLHNYWHAVYSLQYTDSLIYFCNSLPAAPEILLNRPQTLEIVLSNESCLKTAPPAPIMNDTEMSIGRQSYINQHKQAYFSTSNRGQR